MKLAIFSESSADEAALRILVDGLLQEQTEAVSLSDPRSRGWANVVLTLARVIAHLHYRTDADGLVVVADSDGSPTHQTDHDAQGADRNDCRLCQLRLVRDRTLASLRPMQHRRPLKVAVGLAYTAIEAWLRHGVDVHVTENAWFRARAARKFPFTTASLKQDTYGTRRPSLEQETSKMVTEAHRLSKILPSLEAAFPIGFGTLAHDVRRWKGETP